MKKIIPAFFLVLLAFDFQKSFAQKATLDHVSIFVKDLKKSTAFYQNIMHLDTIPEPFHDGRHTWFKVGEGLQLHVIAGAAEMTAQQKANHICFSTPALKDFMLSLTKAGIVYGNYQGTPNTVQQRVDGVQQIYFTDPDGYWIEVNDMASK